MDISFTLFQLVVQNDRGMQVTINVAGNFSIHCNGMNVGSGIGDYTRASA